MLKKIKIYSVSPEVKATHSIFSKKENSEHIATPVSLEALSIILKKHRPQRILEIGGGIGTLSYHILKYSNANLDVYEDLPFCVDALKNVLAPYGGRYKLIETYNDFSPSYDYYDLVIVDGGPKGFMREITNKLSNFRVIYIDGNRETQRKALRKGLSKKHVFRVKKYIDGSKLSKGGYEIICRPNNIGFVRNINYWYWELFYQLSAKIRNFLKRITRGKYVGDYRKTK